MYKGTIWEVIEEYEKDKAEEKKKETNEKKRKK
jgi:hypothetical protein